VELFARRGFADVSNVLSIAESIKRVRASVKNYGAFPFCDLNTQLDRQ
jgi:hypothetical protein